MVYAQGYNGAAVGKGRQLAKTELEKLKLSELTTREAAIEAARMYVSFRITCVASYQYHDQKHISRARRRQRKGFRARNVMDWGRNERITSSGTQRLDGGSRDKGQSSSRDIRIVDMYYILIKIDFFQSG